MPSDPPTSEPPAPFDDGKYHRLRQGVYDCDQTEVWLNQEGDFAFLNPRPSVDYVAYKPRVQKLDLAAYKKTLDVVSRRFLKVAPLFALSASASASASASGEEAKSVLEVGAADGAFLRYAAEQRPSLRLAAMEVDQNTRSARDEITGLVQYDSLDAVVASGERYDLVCFFHVLEHIFDPAEFLAKCRACLAPGGQLVIEVPSLDDPLLSLYASEAYARFYFQRQHPYVYSARSLCRLLEHEGLRVTQLIHHQRYGLENHLHWLRAGKPGGHEELRQLFGDLEGDYRRRLEEEGRSDAVIAVAGEPR